MCMRSTIAIYSLWRDSEPWAKRTLSQLEEFETLGYDFEYYFYENDSKDSTADILRSWVSNRSGTFKSEVLNKKKFGRTAELGRLELLSDCRNKCKDLGSSSLSDYSLIIDSDIIFSKKTLEKSLRFLNENKKCVAVSPNVRQNIPDYVGNRSDTSYYDIFPFKDSYGGKANAWDDCPFRNGIDRMRWFSGQAVKCNSCFGGFFLTRTEDYNRVSWSTESESEHVNFCKQLNELGDIFIDPVNKVFTEIDLSRYNLETFKSIARSQ